MKVRTKIFTAFLAAAALFCLNTAAMAQISEYAEGEVLVTLSGSYSVNIFNANNAAEQTKNIANRMSMVAPAGTKTVTAYNELSSGSGRTMAYLKSETKTTEELMSEISGKSGVLGVFPNYKRYETALPNDTLYNAAPIYRWGYDKSNASNVWNDGITGSSDIVVAVVDTGLKYDHADIIDNTTRVGGLEGDYEGFNDAFGAWFTNQGANAYKIGNINSEGKYNLTYDENKIRGNKSVYSNPVYYGDISGHGTHVAGIIGARSYNGKGIAGMNKNVSILPVNVFMYDSAKGAGGGCWDADIIRGLEYVLAVNTQEDSTLKGKVKVVNMSIGGWSPRTGSYSGQTFVYNSINNPYAQAIKKLGDNGILVCAAAGNDGQNINNPSGNFMGKLPFPSAFAALPQIRNMIVVGAAQWNPKSDTITRPSYSNYSNPSGGRGTDRTRYVDIAAPGSDIFSTVPLYNMKGQMRVARYTNGEELPWAYQVLVDKKNGSYPGYQFMQGTSMAAPMVSGAAALLFAQYPDASVKEIKDMLFSGANPRILKTGVSAYGFLDLESSVAKGESIKLKKTGARISSSGMMIAALSAQFDETSMDFDVSQDIENLGLSGMTESEDSLYYVSYDLAYDIADKLTEDEDDEFYGIESLPLFSVASADGNTFKSGDIVPLKFDLEAVWFGGTIGELRMARAKGVSSADALPLTYTMSADSDVDGTYCVSADGAVLSPDTEIALSDDAVYEVTIFTKDNGKFDLNPADGKILDATVIYNVVAAQDTEADIDDPLSPEALPEEIGEYVYEGYKSKGGSGGCNAGFAAMALLALVPVLLRKKK